jgi:hypothetical protein
MLKHWISMLALVALAALVYIFSNIYATLIVLIIVVILPLVSALLMLLSVNGVAIELELPAQMSVDDTRFTCVVQNKSIIPIARLSFSLEIDNRLTGRVAQRQLFTTLGSRRTYQVVLGLDDPKAGTLVITPRLLRVWDCFGLFSRRIKDAPSQTTVVYPHLLEMSMAMETPVETQGEGLRYSDVKKGNEQSEILGIREYEPSDEVRRIHWKLSSKVDKLLVRDFSLPLNYAAFLLVELSSDSEVLSDGIVTTGLSLASALIEAGLSYNLAFFDAATGRLEVCEIADITDLEIGTARLLGAYSPNYVQEHERGSDSGPLFGAAAQSDKDIEPAFTPALDYYQSSHLPSNQVVLIYVATSPDPERMQEVELIQRLTVVDLYEQDSKDLPIGEEHEAQDARENWYRLRAYKDSSMSGASSEDEGGSSVTVVQVM